MNELIEILCLSPVLIYNTYPLNIPSTGIFHLTTSRLGYVEMLVEIEVRRTELIEHGQAEKKNECGFFVVLVLQ